MSEEKLKITIELMLETYECYTS